MKIIFDSEGQKRRFFMCDHESRVTLTRSSHMVDGGMRKVIETEWKCPTCGLEWEETEYV